MRLQRKNKRCFMNGDNTCSQTVTPLHCKEKQWECTKCELSPCHQK
ncbi:hypothetical protein T01_6630 [Trichinella spiralis]|uniref:Uncharacterized protein n=1 Tax=Trichinella spiralis TaxID=6334 RepID=A0A0V0YZ95_TRISP|nr:hypothetical protein T01_6630 [Trichinella spiralis]